MIKSKWMIALAVLSVSSFAFAGDVKGIGEGIGGGKGLIHPPQGISWEEFQAHCANPASFNEQVAPANIVIQCTGVSTEFVPVSPGSFVLTATGSVSVQVTSDKWVVGGIAPQGVETREVTGSCLRYKEVAKTLTVEHALTCPEVIGLKGTINDYCQGAVAASKGSNPKLGSVVDTGRVVDTCSGLDGGNIPGVGRLNDK
ncbi:MAG: hypothetical protein P4M08_08595 [Oligoflexia bacterium]|nr:hypothetical protein [Oligoflexia bacterium]